MTSTPRKPPRSASKSIHRSASKTPSTQSSPIRHRAMYLDIHEPKEVLRESLIAARQQMSEAYEKEFTAVALSADCNVVDQLRNRLHSLRVRENLLRRAVPRLYPRFRRDSLRFFFDSPGQTQDENESRVSLLLGSIPSFTLFPGAIVGVEGTMNNRIISVTHLYSVALHSPRFHTGIPLESAQNTPRLARLFHNLAVGGARTVLLPRRRRFRASQNAPRARREGETVPSRPRSPCLLWILSSADRFCLTPPRTFSISPRPPSSRRSGRSCAVSTSPRFWSPRSRTRWRSPRSRSLPTTTRQFQPRRAIPACWRSKACGSACRTATC